MGTQKQLHENMLSTTRAGEDNDRAVCTISSLIDRRQRARVSRWIDRRQTVYNWIDIYDLIDMRQHI